jgi:MFS superfamily sulfate permease-like transporter
MKQQNQFFADFSAAIVVFLVALPLCLGIALGSNLSPFSGIIAGVVGGIVVGAISKSPLSVSGPAAGLISIVVMAIADLPKDAAGNAIFGAFFLAVFLAGVLQIILGILKAGVIGNYIPSAVIKGMLAAIGLLLILKQIPHFLGRDTDPEGDETFVQTNGENTFTAIIEAIKNPTLMAIVIGTVGIAILVLWNTSFFKKNKIFTVLSGPLVVVVVGVLLASFFKLPENHLLESEHHVKLQVAKTTTEFFSFFSLPDFSFLTSAYVWKTALTIAIIASLETLLSIEAIDKMDPQQRVTPTNRELVAQGTGNIISGLLGGLPITSVIVRSSANLNAGAKTKRSAIIHGIFLLSAAAFIPALLNLIPKAALAAILIVTGFKLASPSVFKALYKKGYSQIVPFVVTIVAILATDLLKGVGIGIVVAFYYIIKSNYKTSITSVNTNGTYLLSMRSDVSFLNKLIIKNALASIPNNSELIIDCTNAHFIDYDVQEEIFEFKQLTNEKNIQLEIKTNYNQKFLFN